MRKNPYPNYTDCEDAINDLYAEIMNMDLEAHKEKLHRIINLPGYSVENSKALKSMVDRLQTPEDFIDSYKSLKRLGVSLAAHYPAFSMMSDVQIVENVGFVHFFPETRYESISKFGLYGRATPNRMTLTREVCDFYIKDNGFVFAYEVSDSKSIPTDTVVNFSCRIEGVAKKAIKFYFVPDREFQMIVPLKCIDTYKIVSPESNVTYDFTEYDDMMDPVYYRIGSEQSCDKCDALFKLKEDSIYAGHSLFCEDCLKSI